MLVRPVEAGHGTSVWRLPLVDEEKHGVTRAKATIVTVMGILALAASACGGADPEQPDPETTTPSPAAPESPPPGEQECFSGTFRVESIESTTTIETPIGEVAARGEAGSMTLTIDEGGSWTLADDGSQPVTFDLAGVPVEATIEGSATGTYTEAGEDEYQFATTETTGGGWIDSPVGSHEFSLEEVGSVLVPDGVTTVTCEGDEAVLTSETVVMVLAQQG
jgi:hypothetical protein